MVSIQRLGQHSPERDRGTRDQALSKFASAPTVPPMHSLSGPTSLMHSRTRAMDRRNSKRPDPTPHRCNADNASTLPPIGPMLCADRVDAMRAMRQRNARNASMLSALCVDGAAIVVDAIAAMIASYAAIATMLCAVLTGGVCAAARGFVDTVDSHCDSTLAIRATIGGVVDGIVAIPLRMHAFRPSIAGMRRDVACSANVDAPSEPGTLCCILLCAVSIPETGGASNAFRAKWHT